MGLEQTSASKQLPVTVLDQMDQWFCSLQPCLVCLYQSTEIVHGLQHAAFLVQHLDEISAQFSLCRGHATPSVIFFLCKQAVASQDYPKPQQKCQISDLGLLAPFSQCRTFGICINICVRNLTGFVQISLSHPNKAERRFNYLSDMQLSNKADLLGRESVPFHDRTLITFSERRYVD